MADAKQNHDRLSQAMELARAYAGVEALQAPGVQSRVPWEIDQLAVPIARAILAAFATVAEVAPADGLAGSLASLASVSSATRTIPAEWEDRLYDQLKSVLGEWAPTMNRRKLLRLLGWAASIVAAHPVSGLDPDEQERLVRALALPSRVDGPVIDHIETMLQHCKRQEDALGPQAVLQTVLAQRQLVNSLLGECPDSLRPRLLSVYSSMSTSVGAYCFNLDDAGSAQHYCDQARAAAQEARDTELAIHALCTMSFLLPGRAKRMPVWTVWQLRRPSALKLMITCCEPAPPQSSASRTQLTASTRNAWTSLTGQWQSLRCQVVSGLLTHRSTGSMRGRLPAAEAIA